MSLTDLLTLNSVQISEVLLYYTTLFISNEKWGRFTLNGPSDGPIGPVFYENSEPEPVSEPGRTSPCLGIHSQCNALSAIIADQTQRRRCCCRTISDSLPSLDGLYRMPCMLYHLGIGRDHSNGDGGSTSGVAPLFPGWCDALCVP